MSEALDQSRRARPAITRRRKELGLTQVELAEQTSCSQRMISAIELGESDPSLGLAQKIANALDVGLDDLFPSEVAS